MPVGVRVGEGILPPPAEMGVAPSRPARRDGRSCERRAARSASRRALPLSRRGARHPSGVASAKLPSLSPVDDPHCERGVQGPRHVPPQFLVDLRHPLVDRAQDDHSGPHQCQQDRDLGTPTRASVARQDVSCYGRSARTLASTLHPCFRGSEQTLASDGLPANTRTGQARQRFSGAPHGRHPLSEGESRFEPSPVRFRTGRSALRRSSRR